jgi:hypothetical protein
VHGINEFIKKYLYSSKKIKREIYRTLYVAFVDNNIEVPLEVIMEKNKMTNKEKKTEHPFKVNTPVTILKSNHILTFDMLSPDPTPLLNHTPNPLLNPDPLLNPNPDPNPNL